MRLATWVACGGGGGGVVMVVGSGAARGVVVLVVVVLVVVLGGEGSGCGGERLPRSPSHARALQNSLLSSPTDLKVDMLSRYPGQDDYISKCSRPQVVPPSLPSCLYSFLPYFLSSFSPFCSSVFFPSISLLSSFHSLI